MPPEDKLDDPPHLQNSGTFRQTATQFPQPRVRQAPPRPPVVITDRKEEISVSRDPHESVYAWMIIPAVVAVACLVGLIVPAPLVIKAGSLCLLAFVVITFTGFAIVRYWHTSPMKVWEVEKARAEHAVDMQRRVAMIPSEVEHRVMSNRTAHLASAKAYNVENVFDEMARMVDGEKITSAQIPNEN